jgi:hypothetical protein
VAVFKDCLPDAGGLHFACQPAGWFAMTFARRLIIIIFVNFVIGNRAKTTCPVRLIHSGRRQEDNF